MMTVKTEAGLRRVLAEMKKEFVGDSTPYARGYKAALREVGQALTGDPRSPLTSADVCAHPPHPDCPDCGHN